MAGGTDERTDAAALDQTAAATADSLGSGPVVVRAGAVEPPAAVLVAGATVGRYVIAHHLGSGGMGSVYRARDPDLGRDLAIKVLHPHLADHRARLLHEGQAIARLKHPNVVTIHDIGAHGDGLFIAMELIEGLDLRRWLAAAPRTPAEINAVYAEAGRGLAAAHAARMVHRDFKPDNVLVGDDGRVIVTDFGLAHADETTPEELVAGTPLYMSPEQFTGGAVDAASDQFSFCVALYAALFGKRPFDGTTLDAIHRAVTEGEPATPPATPGVTDAVRDAVLRGLARRPADRHASMAALVAQLAPAPPAAARRRSVVPFAVGGGLVALAIVIYAAARRDDPAIAAPVTPIADPCGALVGRIDTAWSPAVRDATAKRFAAAPAAAGDLAQLDAFVARWRTLRGEACRAHADATATCLDRAATALDDLETWHVPYWLPLPELDRCTGANPRAIAVTPLPETPPPNAGVEMAPDGARYIAEATNELVDRATARRRPLGSSIGYGLLAWTDTDQLLLNRGSEIVRYDLARETTVPDAELAHADHAIAARADGTAIITLRDGKLALEVRGEPPVALGSDTFPRGASFSRDGTRAAVVRGGAGGRNELAIVEVATHAITVVPIRAEVGPWGLFQSTWLDAHRLVVSAAVANHDASLWLFHDDAAGRFGAAPTLLVRAKPHTAFEMPQHAGGTLFALEQVTDFMTGKLVDGALVETPGTRGTPFDGITRDGKTMLLHDPGEVTHALDLGDKSVTKLDGKAIPHGTELLMLARCGDAYCFGRRGAPAPIARTPNPNVVCNAGGCVTWSIGEDRAVIVQQLDLATGAIGEPQRLLTFDTVSTMNLAVSPDGKRVAIPVVEAGGGVLIATLGAPRTQATWAEEPGCRAQFATWIDDHALAVTEMCNQTRAVARIREGHPAQRLHTSPNWISAIAATADGGVYITERVESDRLVEIDGIGHE